MPFEISAVSVLLGFPLHVSRVEPRSKLAERIDFDNQWATWMMIEPVSGFAPPQWQAHVGPVVVWRPDADGGAVSSQDMKLFHDFLSTALDRYSDGDVVPERDLTPEAWAESKRCLLYSSPVNKAGTFYHENGVFIPLEEHGGY